MAYFQLFHSCHNFACCWWHILSLQDIMCVCQECKARHKAHICNYAQLPKSPSCCCEQCQWQQSSASQLVPKVPIMHMKLQMYNRCSLCAVMQLPHGGITSSVDYPPGHAMVGRCCNDNGPRKQINITHPQSWSCCNIIPSL